MSLRSSRVSQSHGSDLRARPNRSSHFGIPSLGPLGPPRNRIGQIYPLCFSDRLLELGPKATSTVRAG